MVDKNPMHVTVSFNSERVYRKFRERDYGIRRVIAIVAMILSFTCRIVRECWQGRTNLLLRVQQCIKPRKRRGTNVVLNPLRIDGCRVLVNTDR